jgi:hypothetical protein
MALINITPVMTSNVLPSPYVASASSESASYFAWKAFDGTVLSEADCWSTVPSTTSAWIKLDFGSGKKVDAFSIQARNTFAMGTPKDFKLYGSNDDLSYEEICTYTSESLWATVEIRLYRLAQSVTFRYYKMIITNVSVVEAPPYIYIGNIKFLQDDGIPTTVTNTKASMNYCLPKNSTLAMTQRQNDSREGLLGFSNDANSNYGTLYMVDNVGKAVIPRTAMAMKDILFAGKANTVGTTYTLSKPITDYQIIIIRAEASDADGVTIRDTTEKYVNINDIILNSTKLICCGGFWAINQFYGISFEFITSTTFIIRYFSILAYSSTYITKIYGIK